MYTIKLLILQSIGKLMKVISNGSSIVGYLDSKLRFNILNDVNLDKKKVIIVVGTNGKTTTTNLLNHIYKANHKKVLSNLEGANLISGIKNSIIMDLKGKELKSDIILLEVDEKNVKLVTKELKISHVIVNSFFRDQLDRYFEINIILEEIIDALKEQKPKIYFNGQDPLLSTFFENTDFKLVKFKLNDTKQGTSTNIKEMVYCYNCSCKLEYKYYHFSHIGEYYCDTCSYKVNNISNTFSYSNHQITLDEDTDVKVKLNHEVPLYQVINICTALNFSLENSLINFESLKSINNFKMPEGRNNFLKVKNNELYLTLAKNVVGMEQTISFLNKNFHDINLLIAFNDNYADSKDVSWIWDVDFKDLLKISNSITVVGLRKGDMKLRLLYEGYDNIKIMDTIPDGIDHVLELENPVILTNYTPLRTIKQHLSTLGAKNI